MARRSVFVAVGIAAGALAIPLLVDADAGDGFDGFVQSGTCASPEGDVRVSLSSTHDNDVEPFLAEPNDGSDESIVVGYFGAPTLPAVAFATLFTGPSFSLVIVDAEGTPVACGDLLEPVSDRFVRSGVALVQLAPVDGSTIGGMAVIERAPMERESERPPTRVRVVLTDGEPATASVSSEGFDGYVQPTTCTGPAAERRMNLVGSSDRDAVPYEAHPADGGSPVTLGFVGAPFARGFGLATAFKADHDFSVVLTDPASGETVACGDILKPADSRFVDAGMTLVDLVPAGADGVEGFAIVQRIARQRESEALPVRIQLMVYAPPAEIE